MAACNDLTKREAQVLIKRKFPPRSSGCETRSKGTFGRLYFWLGQVAEGEGRRARTSTGSVSALSIRVLTPPPQPLLRPFSRREAVSWRARNDIGDIFGVAAPRLALRD